MLLLLTPSFIYAQIYYAAVSESVDQAKRHGCYPTYQGSPASKGTLAPDFAGVVPHPSLDWAALRRDVASYGMRNSLLTAIMPTASTAQILGNSESVDPVTTNASLPIPNAPWQLQLQSQIRNVVALSLIDRC